MQVVLQLHKSEHLLFPCLVHAMLLHRTVETETPIVCRNPPTAEDRRLIGLQYMHGDQPGQWYMRSKQGEIVTWDTDDSLKVLTAYITK